MSREITCVLRDGIGAEGQIVGVGGAGWTQDLATAVGEIEAGLRYYVRVGQALIDVVVARSERQPTLCTDPAATPTNQLSELPKCAFPAEEWPLSSSPKASTQGSPLRR